MNLHKAESAFVKSVAKGGTMQKRKNKRFLQAHHLHFHISSFPFQVRQCATAKYGLNFHFSNTFANDSKFKHCNTYHRKGYKLKWVLNKEIKDVPNFAQLKNTYVSMS